MKKTLIKLSTIALSTILCSCAAILIPGKQTVTIKAKEEKVFISKELKANNENKTLKIKKAGVQQVVTKRDGYKDEYSVLLPNAVSAAYYPLRVASWACFIYPGLFEGYLLNRSKKYTYAKDLSFPIKTKLIVKDENTKFYNLDNVSLDAKESDIILHETSYYKLGKFDFQNQIKQTDQDLLLAKQKAEAKASKKKKAVETLDDKKSKDKLISNTIFTSELNKILAKQGFIDTLTNIFKDENNTLEIDGVIRKVDIYPFSQGTSAYHFISTDFYKSRMKIVWKIKNRYGEVLDSAVTEEYSGEFISNDEFEKMFSDNVQTSFFKFINSPTFKKYNQYEKTFTDNQKLLTIQKPKSIVTTTENAFDASVIVKQVNNKSHGSGFAISNDGYIITNFHVIASEKFNEPEKFKVVLSNGKEIDAKIVRVNRTQDLALLKVEESFKNAFLLSNESSFKRLLEVYTIGAPSSLELGQSISIGIISNERSTPSGPIIQVNMSVSPGNSGGPLFDKTGILRGVVAAKLVGYATEAVTFAIPANTIQEALNIKY
jgi:serine protease Do